MGVTFERASKAIEAMVQRSIEQYHPELHKESVTIDVSIARRMNKDEDWEHALKTHGYPIDAKMQITSLQDRTRGIPDAKLTIDAYEWDRMSDKRKVALIDHELEHLDLVPIKPSKKNGFATGMRRDDLGRPKLRCRPHDWELTGFKDVAERHKGHSHEAAQFADFHAQFAQLNLFGGNVLEVAANAKAENTVSLSDENGKVLFEGTDKEFERVATKTRRGSVSAACKARHHARCRDDGCICSHHKQESVEA